MKIGIVEDEAVWADKVGAAIEQCCRKNQIFCELYLYKSGKDFMKSADADLLFLDIELAEGENGFEIAEYLMNSENPCKICFLTAHTELARQGYRVNAFRYIDKKHLEEIEEAIEFFLETKLQERFISCDNTSGIRIKICLKDILLIETNGRKLRYRMLDGSEQIGEGRISETAKNLSRFGFSQIQRSYIVNLKYIEKVNSREVTLCNGMKIAVGRAHSREFKKEFFQWRMRSEP